MSEIIALKNSINLESSLRKKRKKKSLMSIDGQVILRGERNKEKVKVSLGLQRLYSKRVNILHLF